MGSINDRTFEIDNFVAPASLPSGLKEALLEYITSVSFKTTEPLDLSTACVSADNVEEWVAWKPDLEEVLKKYDADKSLGQFPGFHSGERYEILTKDGRSIILGKGTYGTVYLAQDKMTNDLVAIKAFHKVDSIDNYEADLREVSWTRKARALLGNNVTDCRALLLLDETVSHDYDHVLAVFDFVSVWDRLPVSMMLHDAMTLEATGKSVVSQDQWQSIFLQLIDSMNKLEDANIAHLDIKNNNIMLQFGSSGEVTPVIIDFGLATNPKVSHLLPTDTYFPPTPEEDRIAHHPPELYTGPVPLPMADLYSVMYLIYDISLLLNMTCVSVYAWDYTYLPACDRLHHEEVKNRLIEIFTKPCSLDGTEHEVCESS